MVRKLKDERELISISPQMFLLPRSFHLFICQNSPEPTAMQTAKSLTATNWVFVPTLLPHDTNIKVSNGHKLHLKEKGEINCAGGGGAVALNTSFKILPCIAINGGVQPNFGTRKTRWCLKRRFFFGRVRSIRTFTDRHRRVPLRTEITIFFEISTQKSIDGRFDIEFHFGLGGHLVTL